MSAEKNAIKTTYRSIVGNFFLAVLKWIVGYFGNSYALIADAIESTADIFSSFLVLIGIKFANKPADKNHPYGHGKAEPLITFLVVAFLIVSACIIAFESIKNILTPHELPKPYTLIVLVIVIVIKEFFYRFVTKKNEDINSSSLHADAWHHRSDAITSFTALIGISIALLMGKGYEAADDWAALVAAGIIFVNSYLILRPALGEIMDEHFYDDLVSEIKMHAKDVEGVIDTEKCHIRKTGIRYYVDLHMIVRGEMTVHQGHLIAHNLKDHLLEKIPSLADVLIHIEPDVLLEK